MIVMSRRVAMVVSNVHRPDVRVHKEAAALAKAGFEVTVYAFDREHEGLPQYERIDGVDIERIAVRLSRVGNLLETGMGLLEFRSEVRRRLLRTLPVVVHCHDQDTCAVGVWWKRRGGKFVFDAHDLYWTWLLMPDPLSAWRRAGAVVLRELDRRYAMVADLLITTSEAIGPHPGFAETYRELGVDPLVIWNAPDVVEEIAPFPHKFTVGYMGNVREASMFKWLIRAVEKLPENDRPIIRIAGAGRSEKEVETELQSAASNLNLEVKTTGAYSFMELPRLMAQTSVQYCVYPTERGNVDRAMAVKLLDSIAHGRPVIGNASSLMGDFIEKNNWGWAVEPGDIDGLAAALADAHNWAPDRDLSDPPSWRVEANKLIQAYENLVDEHDVSPGES